MFANAYDQASQFTYPLIISLRYFDNTIESSVAAFVVLNRAGWIATAAHVLQANIVAQQHEQEIAAYEAQVRAIQQYPRIKPAAKPQHIRRLPHNPKWIRNFSYWWAGLGMVTGFHYRGPNDLAIGRIEGFDPTRVAVYPTIKNPAIMRQGTSLCKLGFPFNVFIPTYDAATNSFDLGDNLNIPRFPIEGIYTRQMLGEPPQPGEPMIRFIETSTPGLRGQSGGAIFDTQGRLWGIQSHTAHLDLGFSPEVERDRRKITEHQFLNVGMGVHIEVLIEMLQEQGVEFTMSGD